MTKLDTLCEPLCLGVFVAFFHLEPRRQAGNIILLNARIALTKRQRHGKFPVFTNTSPPTLTWTITKSFLKLIRETTGIIIADELGYVGNGHLWVAQKRLRLLHS